MRGEKEREARRSIAAADRQHSPFLAARERKGEGAREVSAAWLPAERGWPQPGPPFSTESNSRVIASRLPPGRRGRGPLRCAVLPPAEGGGGAGPLRLIITPHYEVQSSAISGGGGEREEKQRCASDARATSDPLGHVLERSSAVGNCRVGWGVGERCVFFFRKLPSLSRVPVSSVRLIPEIAETSRTGCHFCFGCFRRLPKRISSARTTPSAHFGDGH